VIQAILNVQEPKPDLEMLRRISAKTGCPLSFTLLQVGGADPGSWRDLLAMTHEARAAGVPITGQMFPRPVGVLLGLDASYHPFSAHPAYLRIADLPLAERVAQMRKPEVRAAILADTPEPRGMLFYRLARAFEIVYPLGDPPNYEPDPSTSIAAMAAARCSRTTAALCCCRRSPTTSTATSTPRVRCWSIRRPCRRSATAAPTTA
jgi:N-acyl-D-amino-acid deacylase